MKKILFLICSLVGLIRVAEAQIDPLYAQYLNNPLLINPAYTGLNNNLNASLTYRKQWAGFDGSPATVNASVHSTLVDNKMGAGLFILQDKAGINKNTEIQATYAYRLDLKDKFLSFGLQAGVINFRSNEGDLNAKDPSAPEFSGNQNYSKPTLGAGLILSSERYFLGLSVPRMVKAKAEFDGQETDLYQQHFYLTGAYVVFVTERIRFKPAVLFRGVNGAPVSADVNASFNIDERYTAGVYTRNFNTYGLMAQLRLKDNLRLGYAFEVPVNNSVGSRFTSHEFTVGINMALLNFHSTALTNF
jgi:type IX secretion system PorP/SprF family membrane protein